MREIEETLQSIGGNLTLAVLNITDKHRHLYLLLQDDKNPILVCGLLLQHNPINKKIKNNSVLYIQSLDTTGNFQPRDHQSKFTKQFVKSILTNLKPSLISCFAHPKEELIFGSSAENKSKKMLGAKDLLEYWLTILEPISKDGELFIYSNYYPQKNIPYKNIDDIYLFEDDPVYNLIKSVDKCSIDELYHMLQYRKDFSKGSLIYVNLPLNKNSLVNEINGDVQEILCFLRGSNFSTYEENIKSTKQFINKFDCQLKWFNTEDIPINTNERTQIKEVVKLVPKPKIKK